MKWSIDQQLVRLFAVGKIVKSVGVKGEVKVEPLTHAVNRFEQLPTVYVGHDDSDARQMLLIHARQARDSVVLTFENCDSRTEAEQLIGNYVFVDEQHSIPPPPGSYFIHDIVGCEVWRAEFPDTPVGTIVEIFTRSQGFAHDIWVLKIVDREPVWIPAVRDFIENVDVAQRRITVRRLEELMV